MIKIRQIKQNRSCCSNMLITKKNIIENKFNFVPSLHNCWWKNAENWFMPVSKTLNFHHFIIFRFVHLTIIQYSYLKKLWLWEMENLGTNDWFSNFTIHWFSKLKFFISQVCVNELLDRSLLLSPTSTWYISLVCKSIVYKKKTFKSFNIYLDACGMDIAIDSINHFTRIYLKPRLQQNCPFILKYFLLNFSKNPLKYNLIIMNNSPHPTHWTKESQWFTREASRFGISISNQILSQVNRHPSVKYLSFFWNRQLR